MSILAPGKSIRLSLWSAIVKVYSGAAVGGGIYYMIRYPTIQEWAPLAGDVLVLWFLYIREVWCDGTCLSVRPDIYNRSLIIGALQVPMGVLQNNRSERIKGGGGHRKGTDCLCFQCNTNPIK